MDPAVRPELDRAKLAELPEGYRHLGYLQSLIGFKINPDLPGRSGPALEALYARGRAWLKAASPA